ncbi:MAG: CrcB family protein, partial [Acidimicrobiia bacterium]|nr:CrcB family protein [Acidimicrobiia bacterium]
GTMVANITGAFVLGFVVGAFSQKLDPVIGLGVTVGLLGGYTTFSTWMFDSVQLWRDGQFAAASINVGVAVLLGLAAAGAGLALGLAVDKGRSAV